jgi:thiamine pyrophosphokinase
VIGDFDSLHAEEIALLTKSNTQIIQFPQRKDFTDLELALQHVCKLEIKDVWIFGALGLRWDQTLANLLLPALPELQCVNIRFIDGNQEILLLRAGKKNVIEGAPGDIVSLIPIAGNVSDICSENLEYTLDHDTLCFGASRGVSNQLTTSSATITHQVGLLICTIIHQKKDRK